MINSSNYEKGFWNIMRGSKMPQKDTDSLMTLPTNTYPLPRSVADKYGIQVTKNNVFRRIATVLTTTTGTSNVWVRTSDDVAKWITDHRMNYFETVDEFTKHRINTYEIAVITKLSQDFINDMNFDIEQYLIGKLGECFGLAEEEAFISGTGVAMPTGILHDTDGAKVGVTTSAITFDEMVKLFFSVLPKYRTNATWLMNDETAQILRTLKDAEGNYIWNHANDTIMGKPVSISNFMPSTANGAKPIAFGDFNYYWVAQRRPLTVRTLSEKYALQSLLAYLAFEYLDGLLVRPEAIKVIQIAE